MAIKIKRLLAVVGARVGVFGMFGFVRAPVGWFAGARTRVVGLLVALAGLLGLWAVALVGSAAAALPSNCSQSGSTVTCTFSSTGSEQTFTVAAGVSSVAATAVGGRGGAGGSNGGAGGFGGTVTGNLSVTGGETLYVEVAGNGAGGGFNGGAVAGAGDCFGAVSGGGGGASDVRTSSMSASGSLSSRLLVAAGGGGGGVGAACAVGGPGGAGGSAGQPGTSEGSGGGGAGTTTSGGAGGAADTIDCVVCLDGGPGTFGAGGPGGGSDVGLGGGGGGGGVFGGGGGGESGGNGAGGGGGGSNLVPAGGSASTDATGTPSVAISYTAPTAEASPASLSFAAQPQGTLSPSHTVTLTNTGGNQLLVYGLGFTGSDPQEFLITSNECLGPIAAGASCTLGVGFAPQAQGARSATLEIVSNDPNSPASMQLSGTGDELPQGPPGQTGQTGATGTTGATGPRGPAGQIELVVCNKITKKVTTKGHKHKVTVQRCRTKLVSGTVKFTIDGDDLGASVSRAHFVYATGVAVPMGTGHWQLVLTRGMRELRSGRYTLTLRTLRGRHRVVERTTITIT